MAFRAQLAWMHRQEVPKRPFLQEPGRCPSLCDSRVCRLLLGQARTSNFKHRFSDLIWGPFQPPFPFSCLSLATRHQALHNDQLALGSFGPRCAVAGGAFRSQEGSDFISH